CLMLARELLELTDGAFDVALGTGLRELAIDPVRHSARWTRDPAPARRVIDLGGLGKGFALDAARAVLSDWDLDAGWITSGQSTVRSLGPVDVEPVPLRDPNDPTLSVGRLLLAHRALSGSANLGAHIVDPRDPSRAPETFHRAAWCLAADASVSDALSTAFLLLSSEEVATLCARIDGVSAIWIDADGRRHSAGSPVTWESESRG
ncbi:MAG: FAD:protein FMN transferase, partial [Planctomycetes bacterium]|nr:FAD:protein FMN transferase [Planctomycetota bacterium]